MKREGDDGLVYDAIRLKPNSSDPAYKAIEIDLASDDVRIVAVLVAVLH